MAWRRRKHIERSAPIDPRRVYSEGRARRDRLFGRHATRDARAARAPREARPRALTGRLSPQDGSDTACRASGLTTQMEPTLFTVRAIMSPKRAARLPRWADGTAQRRAVLASIHTRRKVRA